MTIKRNPAWLNAKGQGIDPTLEPPDLNQCQARPNMLSWGPFTLGPKPAPIRCEKTARFVAVENKPSEKDPRVGAMSLCGDCLVLMRKHLGPTHAKVYPIPLEQQHAKR